MSPLSQVVMTLRPLCATAANRHGDTIGVPACTYFWRERGGPSRSSITE